MKKIFSTPNVLLFAIFLVSGLLTGRATGKAIPAMQHTAQGTATIRIQKNPEVKSRSASDYPLPGSTSTAPAEDATTLNPAVYPTQMDSFKQQNVLLVLVDQLGTQKSKLEGVWLLLYFQGNPHTMLMPIYPSSANQYISEPESDEILVRHFKLNKGNELDLGFVMALQEQNIWWKDAVIVDVDGVQTVLDAFNGQPEQSALHSSAVDNLDAASPIDLLLTQARWAQEICLKAPLITQLDPRQVRRLLEQLENHTSTNIDLAQAAQEWIQRQASSGGMTCEFPSMAAALLIP